MKTLLTAWVMLGTALLAQSPDQGDGHAAQPEPAHGERGAVGDVGDGLAG